MDLSHHDDEIQVVRAQRSIIQAIFIWQKQAQVFQRGPGSLSVSKRYGVKCNQQEGEKKKQDCV